MKQNWPGVDGFGNRAVDKERYYIFLFCTCLKFSIIKNFLSMKINMMKINIDENKYALPL